MADGYRILLDRISTSYGTQPTSKLYSVGVVQQPVTDGIGQGRAAANLKGYIIDGPVYLLTLVISLQLNWSRCILVAQ